MKRKLPPFPALRAFESAARLMSFKRAADELCVTPSAISHQVRTLETFLERCLFERAARQLHLTDDGKSYLRDVGPLLDALDLSTRQIAGEICAGPLTVASPEGFCKRWLIPRLPKFLEMYPDVDVQLRTAMPPTRFENGSIDIVIHWQDAPMDGVVVEPFLSSTRTPVCSPGFLLANPDLTSPSALRSKTLLRDQYADGWDEWFTCAGVQVSKHLSGPEFAHCELTTSAAEAGVGVALGYVALLSDTLKQGTLKTLFELQSPPRTIYSIAYETCRADDARIIAFRDWVLSCTLHQDLPAGLSLSAAQ